MTVISRLGWTLRLAAIACVCGLALFQCAGSKDAGGAGPQDSDEAGTPSTSEFVGTWRTGVVRELGGTCYPPEFKDRLPAADYQISQASGTVRLGGYDVPLRTEGSTATMVGEGSLSATIPSTGSVVTNHLSSWSLTLGTPALIEYSGTVETKKASGAIETCTLSVVVEVTRS